jgi:hypothetical protein
MEVVVSCVIRSSGFRELVTGRILSNHAFAETCTPHKNVIDESDNFIPSAKAYCISVVSLA